MEVNKQVYEYNRNIVHRIPILEYYLNRRKLRREARTRATEIAGIIKRRDAHGGRAG